MGVQVTAMVLTVTINNEARLFESCYWNGNNVNPLSRTYERASLVPAAAVIPALKAYIVIAAVKKLVVGSEFSLWCRMVNCSLSRRRFARFAVLAGLITLNNSGIDGDIRIDAREVKFLDRIGTSYCESICQEFRGSKAIRYRPSSDRKRYQLVIRRWHSLPCLGASRKRKSSGSGGSMVAKLKLKGIDGRAPPGVEPAA
uniref:Uncharacterized protein n=1 Tax=Strigamia maritima TaxID=126957 RepID=T1IU36_STRMM